MKKKIWVFMLFMLFSVMMCQNKVQAANQVKLNVTNAMMAKGDSFTLKVTGTKKKVKWSSSKKSIATVKNGVVNAKNTGTTYITAKIGKKKYKCKVVVKSKTYINKKIATIYDWTCDDVWNKGFCDIYHYVEDGTDSCGEKMDIEKTVANLKKALKKKNQYNKFMSNLQGKKYKKVKSIWKTLYKEMGKLEKIIDNEMPKHSEDYYFPYEKFSDYIWKFFDIILDY